MVTEQKDQTISRRYMLYEALSKEPKSSAGWIEWSRDLRSKLMKVIDVSEPITVQSIISEMNRNGFIKLIKKSDGRLIKGIVLKVEPPIESKKKAVPAKAQAEKQNGAAPEPEAPAPELPRPVTLIATPRLDEYKRARELYDQVKDNNSPWLAVEFQGDPMAEEFVVVYERYAAHARELARVNAELNNQRRELEYLRLKNNKQLRAGLQSAGVVHGE